MQFYESKFARDSVFLNLQNLQLNYRFFRPPKFMHTNRIAKESITPSWPIWTWTGYFRLRETGQGVCNI